MTQVKELWRLKLMHDYFTSGRCSYGKPVLSSKSELLLNRRQCRLLQVGAGEWELFSFNEGNFDDADTLEVDFVIDNKDFLYNTQWTWKADGTCPQIEIGIDTDVKIDMATLSGKTVNCRQNVFFQLVVSLRKVNDERMTVAELDFTAKRLYWEYWFIPRDGNVGRKLELEIINGEGCRFIRYENMDNPLQMPLMAFRTSVPLKLKEAGQEKMNLYEILPSEIRKPLMRGIHVPVPGQIPFKKEDTAIAILYI